MRLWGHAITEQGMHLRNPEQHLTEPLGSAEPSLRTPDPWNVIHCAYEAFHGNGRTKCSSIR